MILNKNLLISAAAIFLSQKNINYVIFKSKSWGLNSDNLQKSINETLKNLDNNQ